MWGYVFPELLSQELEQSQTQEAQIRAAEDIASEVLAALRGEPLRWKIV